MKKIVAVLLVLSLVTGAVFADAKAALNFRAKSSVFTKNGDSMSMFDTTGGNYKGLSDSVSFEVKGDNCGAKIAYNLDNFGLTQLNTYNGWLKIGNLEMGAGVWKDGLLDGSYRVKKDADAGSYEGIDFETYKLGSILKKKNNINFVDNMAWLSGTSSLSGQSTVTDKGKNELVLKSKPFAAYAEYTAKIGDDITLRQMVIGNTGKAWGNLGDIAIKTAIATRTQFNMKGLFNSEFIWKSETKENNAIALFVSPKMVKGFDATIGGSVDLSKGENKGSFGIDLRARYQVNKELSITSFNNFSSNKVAGSEVGKALATAKEWNKAKSAMWNQLGARYIINDAVTAYMNVGLLSDLTKETKNKLQLRVTPGAQIYAAKNAFINVGVAISNDFTAKKTLVVEVPVIFRVKL